MDRFKHYLGSKQHLGGSLVSTDVSSAGGQLGSSSIRENNSDDSIYKAVWKLGIWEALDANVIISISDLKK